MDETDALAPDHGRMLLQLASDVVAQGLHTGAVMRVNPAELPQPLCQPGASFVTLHIDHRLRGCIGSLRATRPLAEDVAANAFAAAFRDPRFPPVTVAELVLLDFHLSILNPAQPMTVADEADLLRQLRPNVDGLILADGGYRATFLPAVWEQLPDPRDFLSHLKRKAGLLPEYWSPSMSFQRYTCQSIP
ncbi:MAG: AmmeMemoRadiSam system protein A [Phycisphaeraceae bacterium]|nr:AmmeMemoRadiSam system protein A [Phycisphaeraceae bacterium]